MLIVLARFMVRFRSGVLTQVCLTFLALLFVLPLHAQDTDWVDDLVQPGDNPAALQILDDYLREAAANNPELRAQFNTYRSQLEEAPQVGTLPDPEVMFGYFTNPAESASVLGRFRISAQQRFPWFGTLQARRAVQDRRADAAFERFEQARLELFRDVQQAWFRYVAIERAVALTEQNLALLEGLLPLVETRYATARAGQADVLRIQMERDELRTLLDRRRDELRPVQAHLNELLGRERRVPIETPERLPDATRQLADELPLQQAAGHSNVSSTADDELLELIIERHPGFRALEAEDEAYRAADRAARLEGRPSFSLGVEVMGRDFGMMNMMDDMNEAISLTGSIRIPLFRARYRAQQDQAAIGRETVALEEQQLRRRLAAEVEEHLTRFRNASRQVRLYRERLVPQARQTLDVLETDYVGDRAGFDEIIQMQRQLLDYAIALYDALAEQYIALAELEALAGTRLDQRTDYQDAASLP